MGWGLADWHLSAPRPMWSVCPERGNDGMGTVFAAGNVGLGHGLGGVRAEVSGGRIQHGEAQLGMLYKLGVVQMLRVISHDAQH